MTTNNPDPLNPDPLEVPDLPSHLYEEYPAMSAQAHAHEVQEYARAIIAQHYAPVIAENERLRELIEQMRCEMNGLGEKP